MPKAFCGNALVLNSPQRLNPAHEIGRLVSAIGPLLKGNSKTATVMGTLRPVTAHSYSSACVFNACTVPAVSKRSPVSYIAAFMVLNQIGGVDRVASIMG